MFWFAPRENAKRGQGKGSGFFSAEEKSVANNQSKLRELELLKEKVKLQENLPHLYGFKKYRWGREFFESRNKVNLLCSANQIGKSTEQISKCIEWATNPLLWKTLWKSPPRQFWYLYPSSPLATVEVDSKWIPDLLPRGELKDHKVFGWKAFYKAYFIQSIKFNSGVTIYFKTYSQNEQDLQASSPHAIFCDEEVPVDIYDELNVRLVATDGHFHSVFTATIGQEFWREAIEMRGSKERFPDAFKRQVSMYDCLFFEDGTPSHWTEERITRFKASCKSQAEIDRRVYGRFVIDSGLRYPGFDRARNVCESVNVPDTYRIFIGVDPGSGGDAHPSAVACVAVSPDMDKAYVFDGQRFDGQITTASDVVKAVMEMKAPFADRVEAVFYDYANADIREIAFRMGETWLPAEKSHAVGESRLNVLFKNGMLKFFDIPQLQPHIYEFLSNKSISRKTEGGDDAVDATRYAVSRIPFDWSKINGELPVAKVKIPTETERRRAFFAGGYEEEKYDVESELEEWNSLY